MPRKQSTKRTSATELEQLRTENRRLKQIIAKATDVLRTPAQGTSGLRLRVFGSGPKGGRLTLRSWGKGPQQAVLAKILKERNTA